MLHGWCGRRAGLRDAASVRQSCGVLPGRSAEGRLAARAPRRPPCESTQSWSQPRGGGDRTPLIALHGEDSYTAQTVCQGGVGFELCGELHCALKLVEAIAAAAREVAQQHVDVDERLVRD